MRSIDRTAISGGFVTAAAFGLMSLISPTLAGAAASSAASASATASPATAATVPAAPWVAMSVDPKIAAYRPQPVGLASDAPFRTRDGAVGLGGANHTAFIVERFNALFTQTHPAIRFASNDKGTTSAIPLLSTGTILFAPVGRGINPGERRAFREAVGAEPIEIRVAHASNDTSQHLATSLSVYVNRENPLSQLSTTQVDKMLSIGNPGGDYTRWNQVGLTGIWADRAIHPYGTPEYTGFGDYLQSTHLDGRRLATTSEQYGDTGRILKRLEDDPAGIAIAAIGKDNARIKALAITDDSGAATTGTPEEIVANRYPYGRFIYFYIRKVPGKPVDPVVAEYIRLVLSREGQSIVASQPNGYMPLSASEVRAELAKLN